MIDGFDHVGIDHVCNVCSCDYTDDEGGIQGYLGILPVSFCPTCYAGIVDMVEQLDEREWEGLTKDEVETLSYKAESNTWKAVELAEAKLKEKNGYD